MRKTMTQELCELHGFHVFKENGAWFWKHRDGAQDGMYETADDAWFGCMEDNNLEFDQPSDDDRNSAIVAWARSAYAEGSDDDVVIDDEPVVDHVPNGAWVQAWVWVPDDISGDQHA